MPTEVSWSTNPLVSSLHAADAVARHLPLADPRISVALSVPAAQLATEIEAAQLPAPRFWRHLIPLAARIDSRRPLVETAVTKTAGRSPRFAEICANLAASVAAVDSAMRAAVPQLADELHLRERPLREQWEARGPGLLKTIGSLTDVALIVQRCDILLVHPALGGSGESHPSYNSVRVEAVLANPVAELPEVLRLAWLIAQLQLDLPAYSESIHADRLPHVAAYAMLPPTLAAAEAMELTRCTPQTAALAIAAWRLPVPAGIDAASLVLDWWQTCQQTRPPWRIALTALDQMFG